MATETTTDLRAECVDKLKSFDGNITGTDKVDACKELVISRPTLDKYLGGDISNIDTAISIIGFFNGRISKRREKLKKRA